jgi:CheY-like chemotaxis protein
LCTREKVWAVYSTLVISAAASYGRPPELIPLLLPRFKGYQEAVKRDRVKKILIVDDNPPLHDIMRKMLQLIGYDSISAATGKECLSKAISEKPDLILLDIDLSDMDGRDVAPCSRAAYEFCEALIRALLANSRRRRARFQAVTSGLGKSLGWLHSSYFSRRLGWARAHGNHGLWPIFPGGVLDAIAVGPLQGVSGLPRIAEWSLHESRACWTSESQAVS